MKPIVLNRHHPIPDVNLKKVYVGRPSRWGNPFNTHKVEDGVIYTREAAVDGFRQYAAKRLEIEPHWLDYLMDAAYLICWCAPKQCHADVLAEMIEHARNQRA